MLTVVVRFELLPGGACATNQFRADSVDSARPMFVVLGAALLVVDALLIGPCTLGRVWPHAYRLPLRRND